MQPLSNIISVFLSSTYVCRCCHSIGSFKDLSAQCNSEGRELYEDLLKITFNIEISSYNNGEMQSSKQICDDCISKLMQAFTFRNMVISSENRMAEYFKQLQNSENDVSNGALDETIIKTETSSQEVTDDPDCTEKDNNYDDCNEFLDVTITELGEPKPDVDDQPKKFKEDESEMKNRKSKNLKSTKEKRKRSQNFTMDEKDKLVKLVYPYKNIILNKRTNSATNQAKNEAWLNICSQYNSSGNMFRSKDGLIRVWEKMKSEAKMYNSRNRSCTTGTGGGASATKTDPVLEQVCDLMSQDCTGIADVLDSDSLITTPTHTNLDL